MMTATIGSQGDRTHQCVVLGQRDALRELQQVLGVIFSKIEIIETIQDIDIIPAASPPDLLLMADSVDGESSPLRLKTAKAKLKPRAIICLTQGVDTVTEIGLREVGLAFLGSYESFFSRSVEIIERAIQRRSESTQPLRETTPAPAERPRIESAKMVQAHLKGRPYPLKRMTTQAFNSAMATLAELLNRSIEVSVGLFVSLVFTLPLYLFFLSRYLITRLPVFSIQTIVGGNGNALTIRRFNHSGPQKNLPLFFSLLTGRLALVGTAIVDWENRRLTPAQGYIRLVKPGIFSLWQVRSAGRIAHQGQEAIEWEYVFKKQPLYDFFLLLRVIPAMIYGKSSQTPPAVLRLLDLDIANLGMAEAIDSIDRAVADATPSSLFFVNPDCLNKMIVDNEYFRVLQQADRIFPDGIGLTVAGKLLQTPLKENINGTDMLPFLCQMAATRGYSLFLLGGRPGVASEAGLKIQEKYGVTVAGTSHGYFDTTTETLGVIDQINQSGADILLVGMGAPMQEKWISGNRDRLAPPVLMGVGGLFDFYSGNIKRAPVWMRESGLEWVYRIVQEPRRMWRRYVVGNPLFLYRVMRWKLFSHTRQG